MTKAEARPPIHSLTGIRFFAAAWVLALHFRDITVTQVAPYPLADEILRHGWLGVDLFFVLSGFILSYVYTRTFAVAVSPPAYRTFILFRFGRIYPVHLATFLIMMVLLVAQTVIESGPAHPERFTPLMIVSTVTMTHAWGPGILSPNMPSWSISAEFFAYLLFPFLIVVITRVRRSAIAFIGIGLLLATVFQALLPLELSLVRVMAGFMIGMAAYHLGPLALPARWQRWGGLSVVLLIAIWASSSDRPRLEVGLPLFAALIVLVPAPRDLVGRFLSIAPLLYLGEISYSLYMVHWPARAVVRTGLERLGLMDTLDPVVVEAAYWSVALIGAVLMFHLIERPGRRLIRSIALRVDPPARLTAAGA